MIKKAKPYWFIETKQPKTYDNTNFHNKTEWKKLRKLKKDIDPLCEHCKEKGIITEGKEIDHIIPVHVDITKALDISNLQTLCLDCHVIKTTKDKRKRK